MWTYLKKSFSTLCPKCEQGKILRNWVSCHDCCPHCGYKFRPANEGWAGPALFSYSVTVLFLVVALAIGFWVNGFDGLEFWSIGAILLGLAINILLYPFVNSIWVYIIYYWRKNDPDYTYL